MTVIRDKRIEKGFSLSDSANEMRVNYSQLSSVERRAMAASAPMRAKVSAFLEMAETDLFDSDGVAK